MGASTSAVLRRTGDFAPLLAGLASAVVPGAGQLMAGRRRRGVVMLAATGGVLAVGFWMLTAGKVTLLEWSVRPVALRWLLVGNGALLAFRVFAAVDAVLIAGGWRLSGNPRRRLAAAGALIAGILILGVPHAIAGWYDVVQYDLITSVFQPTPTPAPAPPTTTSTTSTSRAPAPGGPVAAPPSTTSTTSTTTTTAPPRLWDGTERLNVLLLGGDSGVGRTGVRTDTMILASIDPADGHAVLVSVPRNMARVPLPEELDIWACDCFPLILNELWQYGERNPDRFPGTGPPGAEALKLAITELTGLPVHYYALVDLAGFVDVIDALGGLTITVPERVYDARYPHEDGSTEVIDIQPGEYHMDGHLALAYARSRRTSDDYNRMGRQRCVLEALVAQADPISVLRGLPRLAEAIKRSVSTDIPIERLPDFVHLVPLLDADEILSIRLVPTRFTGPRTPGGYNTPDVDEIQSVVSAALTLSKAEAIEQLGLEELQEGCDAAPVE